MTNNQSDWVFNFVLWLAVIVFLSTLALGLIVGVGPLTALLRSGIAFFSFALLGWAVSLVWAIPAPEEVTVKSENLAGSQLTPSDETSSPIHRPGGVQTESETYLNEEVSSTDV
jgi:hypothetical protein